MVNLNDHVVYHSKPHVKLQVNATAAMVKNAHSVLTYRYASADNDSGHVIGWQPSGTFDATKTPPQNIYDAYKGIIYLNAPGTYNIIGSWSKSGNPSRCQVAVWFAPKGVAASLVPSPAFDLGTPADFGWSLVSWLANQCNDNGVMQLNYNIHVNPDQVPARIMLTANTQETSPAGTNVLVRGCNKEFPTHPIFKGQSDCSFIDITYVGP